MAVTAHPSGTTTAVSAWLSEFGDALAAGDPAGAAALFATECYWRDLVAFTWNMPPAGVKVAVLWFRGGNLAQSRHYSLFPALQLKARQVGLPTPVYGLQEVHHQG